MNVAAQRFQLAQTPERPFGFQNRTAYKSAPAILSGAILAALSFVWFWRLDEPFSYDYDEGVYLESARLFLGGHPPFKETFSSQPPLYLLLLRTAFWAFGDTVVVGRGVSVVFALGVCLLLAKAAWDAIQPWAAPVAIVLCGGAVSFFNQTRVCQAEMAALGFGVAAIAAVSNSRRANRLSWQIAAGALLGAAIGTKLLLAPFVAPILVMVSWRSGQRPAVPRVLPAFVVLSSTIVVLLLLCAPFGLREVYESSVGFRLGARTSPLWKLHRLPLQRFSLQEGLLIPIALAGAIGLARRRSWVLIWCGVWVAACAVFLSWHRPLFDHHLALIVPSLAFTGAAATSLAPPRGWMALVIVTAICALVLAKCEFAQGLWRARFAPSIWARAIASQDSDAARWATVTAIERFTTKTDLLVTDDQMLAFRAGRDTPGELCDTSFVRISRGSLTTKTAIQAASGATLIVLRSGRLNRLPQFLEWVEEHYDPIPHVTASAPERGFYLRREPEGTKTRP